MKLNNHQICEQIEEAESLLIVLLEANDYLRLCYRKQLLLEAQLPEHLDEITLDYQKSRTYWHKDELIYGAKVAWHNSVRDLHHLTTAEEIFAAIAQNSQKK